MKTFGQYIKSKDSRGKPSLVTILGSHAIDNALNEATKFVTATTDGHKEIDTAENTRLHTKVAPLSKKLTDDEESAIDAYTTDSKAINNALHDYHNGKSVKGRTRTLKNIAGIDSLMDKHKTKEDMHVYTGVKESPHTKFKPDANDRLNPINVHLPAYTSTSTHRKVAETFSAADMFNDPYDAHHGHNLTETDDNGFQSHILKIHVPAGTNASSVKSKSYHKEENEILLHRGHDIEIHPKPTHLGGGVYMWHAKIVGHSPSKITE
jgi:hypothetical protein